MEHRFIRREIQRHARQFDTHVFIDRMHDYVDQQLGRRQVDHIEDSALMMVPP